MGWFFFFARIKFSGFEQTKYISINWCYLSMTYFMQKCKHSCAVSALQKDPGSRGARRWLFLLNLAFDMDCVYLKKGDFLFPSPEDVINGPRKGWPREGTFFNLLRGLSMPAAVLTPSSPQIQCIQISSPSYASLFSQRNHYLQCVCSRSGYYFWPYHLL